jgi:hypothetical protein
MNTEKLSNEAPNPPLRKGAVSTSTLWELKGHSHQIADTGDYDGYYEITNGKISLLTKDDDDEANLFLIFVVMCMYLKLNTL